MIIKQKQGFTLVEMLVAITILMIGVVGPLGLAARGIADGLYIQNELAAKYLAQEGLELVVAQRLNNFLEAGTWTDNLSCTGSCSIDADAAGVHIPAADGTSIITVNGVPFERLLTLTPVGSNELIATITINWLNKTTSRSYSLSERLYSRPWS